MTKFEVCRSMRLGSFATAAVAFTALALPATGLTSTLDQQCTPPRATGAEPFSGGEYAQSFRAGTSGPLEKASFYLTTYGDPTLQAQVELRAVDGTGMPTGGALATSAQVTATSGWPEQATDFVFPTPANITAGQSYALVGTGNSGVAVRRCTDNMYANGTYLAYFGSWSEVSTGEDLTFTTYIGTPSGGGSQPPPGGSPPSAQMPSVTTVFPKANGKYRRKQLKSIRGTVTNAGSVKEVKISVKRKSGKRCRWLSLRGMKRRSCSKPVWLRARGVKSWKARISKRQRRALKPGSYTLLVRLNDASGNQMSASGRTSVRFRVRN